MGWNKEKAVFPIRDGKTGRDVVGVDGKRDGTAQMASGTGRERGFKRENTSGQKLHQRSIAWRSFWSLARPIKLLYKIIEAY